VATPWVVVTADDAALSGVCIIEGLLRFQRVDPIVGASLILSRGQSIDGLWLEVNAGYTAPMAGRDITTLSQLGSLANVVISAGQRGRSTCDLIEAMFSEESINFVNEVGALANAFNRPSPIVPPILWWLDSDSVVTRGLVERSLSFSVRDY